MVSFVTSFITGLAVYFISGSLIAAMVAQIMMIVEGCISYSQGASDARKIYRR